jgi:hypothetical protein
MTQLEKLKEKYEGKEVIVIDRGQLVQVNNVRIGFTKIDEKKIIESIRAFNVHLIFEIKFTDGTYRFDTFDGICTDLFLNENDIPIKHRNSYKEYLQIKSLLEKENQCENN